MLLDQVTLTALGEMFEAARNIMNWLGDCAKVSLSQFICFSFMLIFFFWLFFYLVSIPTTEILFTFSLCILPDQIIASENEPVRWTTPLGLPVVQPYRKLGTRSVSSITFAEA